jgi:hypothetical protein
LKVQKKMSVSLTKKEPEQELLQQKAEEAAKIAEG